MITSQLLGGLGNTMFQIAAGYTFAIDTNNKYTLSTHGWGCGQGKNPNNYRHSIFKKLPFTSSKLSFPVYNEPELPPPNVKDAKLNGYFHHPKYFHHRQEELRALFMDYKDMKEGYDKDVIKRDGMALHVRRGDHVPCHDHFPAHGLEYIKKAINYIDDKKDIRYIYVFSDDVKWCKQNIKDKRITFIDSGDDVTNILLMTLADNIIMANSTYSYWGGYFNIHRDCVKIAPKQWYGKARLKGEEFYGYTNDVIRL